MRAGELYDIASIFSATGSPPVITQQGTRRCRVDWPTEDSTQHQTALRAPSATMFRFRPDAALQHGRYLLVRGRLYYIDSTLFDRRYNQLAVSVTELRGQPATYQRGVHTHATRAFVARNNAYVGEYGGAIEYRTRIEVPRVEIPLQPAAGDTVTVAGVTHTVDRLAEAGDDGVVLQLVAKP